MPKILRDAHKENDKAVMAAYNFPADFSESDIVAALFQMYNDDQNSKSVDVDGF